MKSVAIVMGSRSDWATLKEASLILNNFGIDHDTLVVSAHRTPDWLAQFAKTAHEKGYAFIIAGAGGSAHLPGMIAALSEVPVLGVPVESKTLQGLDSLLSIVQMPYGIPVATFAIGVAGAKNAALFAVQCMMKPKAPLEKKWKAFRIKQTREVLKQRKIK